MKNIFSCLLGLFLLAVPYRSEGGEGIPVEFTLDKPGFVTLVIDDMDGKRVRNLIAETYFEAGKNRVIWDGKDDVGRKKADPNYEIVAAPVKPGQYRVRGLVRPQIDLRYELSPYQPGNPPWPNNERTGQWLGDHSPPSGVLFVPESDAPQREGRPAPGGQIVAGADVVEYGDGLMWLDLEGKKLHGQKWVGGVWTAAPFLARDAGPDAVKDVYAYTAASFDGGGRDGGLPELRLAELVKKDRKTTGPRDPRFGVGDDRALLSPRQPFRGTLPSGKDQLNVPQQDMRYAFPDNSRHGVGGLAVYNGLMAVSLPKMNQLLWVDAVKRQIVGVSELNDPRGIAFDAQGQLLALSGRQLLRLMPPDRQARVPSTGGDDNKTAPVYGLVPIPSPQVLIATGLDDPRGIALDEKGNIYVSVWGQSHQVKMFDAAGRELKAFGKVGIPSAGHYDALRMNYPLGLTLDGRGRLWVAENDFSPKRISVWKADGSLDRAFYGPHEYGGGGTLDPSDKNRYVYQGMEFKLDWEKGETELLNVLYRYDKKQRRVYKGEDKVEVVEGPDWNVPRFPVFGHQQPVSPERPFQVKGRRYYTNAYSSQPTNGTYNVMIWVDQDGVAVPVAAMGRVNRWPLFQRPEFAALVPPGSNLEKDPVTAFWQDLNGDGRMQPEETLVRKEDTGPVLALPDLSFVTAETVLYRPQSSDGKGYPRYDFSRGERLVAGAHPSNTSGGGQVYPAADGWTILTVPPEPFPRIASVAGAKNGVPMWTYPHLWPGLHISNKAPLPAQLGEMMGGTILMGPPVRPRGGDAGEIWAMKGNKGNVYLLTTDGLFVATLWKDSRNASWNESKAERGMLSNELSLKQEAFYATITQVEGSEEIFVQGGFHGGLNRVEGLEQIRRLPEVLVSVTGSPAEAVAAPEKETSKTKGGGVLTARLASTPPVVDGNAGDWSEAKWVQIDPRTKAALSVGGDRLFAIFETGDAKLLMNTPEAFETLFKTGGALDLMIGAGGRPAAGNSRLLVTMAGGRPAAVLYQPVAPEGAEKKPFTFTSPVTTLVFDRVVDVSDQIELKAGPSGIYEFSAPLSLFGLKPAPGGQIRGDIGILRGDGSSTMQRVYWSNKETALTADVPSEAQLSPGRWGTILFE